MVMSNGTVTNILVALNAAMRSCGYVQKTGKNTFHNYRYAGEGDLLEKLRPALVENGLLLIPSVTHQSDIDEYGNTRVIVEYTLAHVSGEVWPHPIIAHGCGNDRNKNGVGDKGLYKALTGANKYFLFKLFQIETGDDPESTEAAPQKIDSQMSDSVAESLLSALSDADEVSLAMIKEQIKSMGKANPWRKRLIDAYTVRKSALAAEDPS
jgi:hypothetical protein